MKKMVLCAAILCSILLSGSVPTPLQDPRLDQELADLARRGITHRFIDPTTIELKEEWSGQTWLKGLRNTDEAEVRSWAATRGIPILEIDPTLIDTNQYTGWYDYWLQLPISGSPGQPIVVADVDGNDNPEIYGLVTVAGSPATIESRISEVDPPLFRHTYMPYPGVPTGIVDIDNDSLREILFSGQSGVILTDFRQPQQGVLPTTLNFTHMTTNSGVQTSFAPPYVGNLDGDSLVDCLYKVVEIDSADSTLPYVLKLVVAEFDTTSRNLQRVWAMRLDAAIGRFASADFDQDGSDEFVTTGGLDGKVFLFENTDENTYELTYQDSTPFVNLYRIAAGDVDNDGKPEFFVVATQGNGQWALMYEADSNNHYSAKILLHFLSGGSIDFPTYLTNDIDGCGQLELLTTSASSIFVFKSDGDNSYRLWYYKREDRINAVQVYDFNGDQRMDLVISKDSIDQQGRLYYYTDISRATPLMALEEATSALDEAGLRQNYPNPFNPSTSIVYSIPSRERITLKVYNVLGQHVATLIDQEQSAGRYTITWNAIGISSGLYFCQLRSQDQVMTIKLLLLR